MSITYGASNLLISSSVCFASVGEGWRIEEISQNFRAIFLNVGISAEIFTIHFVVYVEPSVQGSMAWPARKNMNSNIRVCRILQISDKRCLGSKAKEVG